MLKRNDNFIKIFVVSMWETMSVVNPLFIILLLNRNDLVVKTICYTFYFEEK